MRAAWPSSTTCTTTGSSGTTWPATTKSRLSVESREIFWDLFYCFKPFNFFTANIPEFNFVSKEFKFNAFLRFPIHNYQLVLVLQI
jgi:hypothetical protein